MGTPTSRSIRCGGQCYRHGMKMNCDIGCVRQRYSICSRVFPSSSLVSDMFHSRSTTILLEGHDYGSGGSVTLEAQFLSLCKCAGKHMSPLNWCGFKYLAFHVLQRGVHCMVIYVLEKRMFYMAFYCKRSGCQVKI